MDEIRKSYLTLSEWAKLNGMTYRKAYDWYKAKRIKGARVKWNRIMVNVKSKNKNNGRIKNYS